MSILIYLCPFLSVLRNLIQFYTFVSILCTIIYCHLYKSVLSISSILIPCPTLWPTRRTHWLNSAKIAKLPFGQRKALLKVSLLLKEWLYWNKRHFCKKKKEKKEGPYGKSFVWIVCIVQAVFIVCILQSLYFLRSLHCLYCLHYLYCLYCQHCLHSPHCLYFQ